MARTTRSVCGLSGFTSSAITLAFGTSSEMSSSRLACSSTTRRLNPVRFPPGRARLPTKPLSAGSSPLVKTIGIVEVAPFAARGARPPPLAPSPLDELYGQRRQPVIVTLGPAVFERDILPLDIADFAQSLAKGS